MILDKKNMETVHINLNGPEGNAFFLISYASTFADKLCYEKEEKNEMISEMISSDYNNLLSVFEKHFGDFVVFYK